MATRGSPWLTFFGSAVIWLAFGWLRWHFVERPALSLKKALRSIARCPKRSLSTPARAMPRKHARVKYYREIQQSRVRAACPLH